MNDNSFITVVSGLPRSGTSLMMQMLMAGGLPALTDNVRSPDENNPRGYLEFEAVKRLRTEQDWIGQAQGRAVKVIHLLVRELPVDGRFQYRLILMQRSIAEVLASQRAMLARDGKPSADAAILEKAYKGQLEQLEDWLGRQSAFKVLPVRYQDLIDQPQPSADRINQFLGGGLNPEAMAKAVDATLYRQRSNGLTDKLQSMKEPEPIWTKSRWTVADLDGALVEFAIPLNDGRLVEGRGKFLVLAKDGLQYVQIRVNMPGKYSLERILHDFQLPQAIVDCIQIHPDQTVARYLVKA